jgi:S1/P1 Nuclease
VGRQFEPNYLHHPALAKRVAVSEAVKTVYCVMHGSSCDAGVGSVSIGADYMDANEPVVKEQLQKAGVRLARILDKAFGK